MSALSYEFRWQSYATPMATSNSLERPSGGIFCATTGCHTKHGRTKGHTECSRRLCKTCCEKASRKCLADGIDHLPCHVRSHRLQEAVGSATRTRGLRSQLQPSQSISGSASSNTPPFDVDLTAAQSTMTSTGMVHDPPPPNPSTHLARSSEKTYAVPIADQWQNPSRGWLQNHQDAAVRTAS